MKFKPFRKLGEHGFDHVILGLGFAVLVALGGTYWLLLAHAATPTYVQLKLNGDNICMGGGTLVECSTTNKEALYMKPTSGSSKFALEDEAGYCVDDWNGTYQSKTEAQGGTRIVARLNTCDSNDANQEWNWKGSGDHELASTGSSENGCLNAAAGDTTAGTEVIVYSCNNSWNENWIESAVSVSNATTPTTTTSSSGPCSNQSCTTGEITSSDTSTCVTAGSSVTMTACTGSANQEWEQLPTTSGSSTEVFYNSSAGAYLGTSGSNIADTSAEAYWTASDNGDGTNTLEQLSNGDTGMCLDASSSTLALASCVGGTSQSFILPNPYSNSSDQSSSSSSTSGDCTFAATAAACESEVSSGSTTSLPFTTSSPSPNTSGDLIELLDALKASGYSFNCSTLSTADISACESVFGS